MRKVIIYYDDSRIPSLEIRTITGGVSYGNTIFKRVSLKERARKLFLAQELVKSFVCDDEAAIEEVIEKNRDCSVVRVFSDFQVTDTRKLGVILEKSLYAKEIYGITVKGLLCGVIYPCPKWSEEGNISYRNIDFDNFKDSDYSCIETDCFLSLRDVNNFRGFITSGFDARFFNALDGDEYTVVKRSTNVEKLRKEYKYFTLLPDTMRMWYAYVYDYRESDSEASYTIERYHMTDLALRYIHGAISTDEFRTILNKLFYFISKRCVKEVTKEEYISQEKSLYVDKVLERIEQLKSCKEYDSLEKYIKLGTKYAGIDGIVEKYLSLYEKIVSSKQFMKVSVVGHGDLCFSNILYNDEAQLLRLIDPKGALNEEDLYMNPYYDIAKLSHSVQGLYDYFNADQFEIKIDEDMRLSLHFDCDNSEYMKIFNECLIENRIDPKLIRLYEASLFLSMLPLHIDREKKVLGFVLNAIKILEELDS